MSQGGETVSIKTPPTTKATDPALRDQTGGCESWWPQTGLAWGNVLLRMSVGIQWKQECKRQTRGTWKVVKSSPTPFLKGDREIVGPALPPPKP